MKARERKDQFVVNYLLGLSSDIEQSQIETRYFRDQSFYEEVLVLEDELICEYLNNDLTREERQRFEQHFLQSPHRRKKLQSTRRLMAYLADQGLANQSLAQSQNHHRPTADALSKRGVLDYLRSLLMPQLSFGRLIAATAVLLVLGFGLTTYIANLQQNLRQTETERLTLQRQEQELRGTALRQQAEATAKRDEAASLSELVASGANSLSAAVGQTTPTPSVKVTLATARNNSQPTEIKLPPPNTSLRIGIELPAKVPEATRFVIKMRAVETTAATWQWETTSLNNQLLLEIPAREVATGVYSLTVARIIPAPTGNEFAGELFIRLTRP